ncbi:MAG: carboxypeptidase regulatory-like domain-containing protein, partial [bacterium]
TLVASHPGYATVETTIVVNRDMTVNLTIRAVGYTVSGTVNLEGGGNLAGTTVRLGTSTTTTDSTGQYRFTDVRAGLARLTFTRTGFVTLDTTILVASDTTVNVTLRRALVSISGTVRLEGVIGDLSGSTVRISAPGVEPVITGPSGQYRFSNLMQDEYTITASHEYFATAETTVLADRDLTINFNLRYLAPVTRLTATYDTLYRPLPPDAELCVHLSWEAPSAPGLIISSYQILRGTDPRIMTPLAETDSLGYDDCTVESGVTYYYTVIVNYVEGGSPEATPVSVTPAVLPDPNTVLVYDFDNGATPCDGGTVGAAEAIASVLEELGVSYTITEQDESLSGRYELSDYRLVIVVTGIYDAVSTNISATDLQKLVRYINGGGKVYVEGPDFAKDYRTTEFFTLFKASYVSDGVEETTGNVQTLKGNTAFFGRYLIWQYAYRTLADRLVDVVSPIAPGVPIWYSPDGTGGYTVVRGVYTSNTAFSACYTGGIVDGPSPYTRARYLAQILDWFGIHTTYAEKEKVPVPKNFDISQNYPNPFNMQTTITLEIPTRTAVSIEIYSLKGERIRTLVNDEFEPGVHKIIWDGKDNSGEVMPSGVYLYRVNAGSFNDTKRMILIK